MHCQACAPPLHTPAADRKHATTAMYTLCGGITIRHASATALSSIASPELAACIKIVLSSADFRSNRRSKAWRARIVLRKEQAGGGGKKGGRLIDLLGNTSSLHNIDMSSLTLSITPVDITILDIHRRQKALVSAVRLSMCRACQSSGNNEQKQELKSPTSRQTYLARGKQPFTRPPLHPIGPITTY